MRAVFILGFSLNLICIAWSSDCETRKVEGCLEDLKIKIGILDEPFIAKNQQDLKEMCGHIEKAFSCIHGFIDKCLPTDQQDAFLNSTIVAKQFVANFCKDGSSTQKEYISHLNCYNLVTSQVKECSREFHEIRDQISKQRGKQEDIYSKLYCFYQNAMKCRKTVVRSCCSDAAADLYDKMDNETTFYSAYVKQSLIQANTTKAPISCSGVSSPHTRNCIKMDGHVAMSSSPLLFSFLNMGSLLLPILSVYNKYL